MVTSGKLFLAPAELVGLSRNMSRGPSRRYEEFASTKTAFDIDRQVRIIEQLDLPYLDRMSVHDMVNFSEDYQDELTRFRVLMKDLVFDHKDISRSVRQVKDAVREIRGSASFSRMRNSVIGIGGALATFNFGLATGLPAKAIGAGFVAHAALQWRIEKTILKKSARSNRAWPIWKLGRGKKRTSIQSSVQLGAGKFARSPDKSALWHWLAPPESGWSIPTAFRR